MPPPTLRSLCLCRLEEEKHCKEDLPLQIVEELRRRRIASHRIQRLLSKWVAVVRRWAAHVGPTMTSFDLQVRYLDGTEIWYTTHSDHTSYVFLESGVVRTGSGPSTSLLPLPSSPNNVWTGSHIWNPDGGVLQRGPQYRRVRGKQN
jgi:hypothetical protein